MHVNKVAYKEMIIQNVILPINEKWPAKRHHCPILIQQDNATSHISENDPDFMAAMAMTELDIKVYFQPSNSPDTNVLDLGFSG